MPSIDDDRAESPDSDAARERRIQALPAHKRALLQTLLAERGRARSGSAETETLRPGPGRALVLIHPVGGEVLCYGELVRLLPGDYPVHGLPADDQLRAAQAPTMDALAEHYLGRLSRAGVRPALLAGWSFGGMLAYEMGRRLSGGPAPCPVLAIDAMPLPAGHVRRPLSEAELIEAFAGDLIRSAGHRPEDVTPDSSLWRLPRRTALSRLHAHLLSHEVPLGLSVDDLLDRATVYVNAYSALDRHRPGPAGPGLQVLWASDTATDATRWWRDVAAGPVTGRAVPADHYTLLRPPAVDEVARFVHDAMVTTSVASADDLSEEDR
jgi:thioesterase domain-containing protein